MVPLHGKLAIAKDSNKEIHKIMFKNALLLCKGNRYQDGIKTTRPTSLLVAGNARRVDMVFDLPKVLWQIGGVWQLVRSYNTYILSM